MSSLPPDSHRATTSGRLPSNRRPAKTRTRHFARLLAALMLPIVITGCGDGGGVDDGTGTGNGSGGGSGRQRPMLS